MMEVVIRMKETGEFSIEKTEDMAVFTAIGMMELAKKLMLDRGDKEIEKIEEKEVDANDGM